MRKKNKLLLLCLAFLIGLVGVIFLKFIQYGQDYRFQFTNIQKLSGIDFKHHPTSDSKKSLKFNHYMHGNGLLVADVNNDGLLDVYFLNQLGSNVLYKNLGKGQFEDITEISGTALPDRVSAGGSFVDFDNDGNQDLFVTSIRKGNVLFKNMGGGVFTDITQSSGLNYQGHSSSSVFFDYDNDGLLDLLLLNIGRFTTELIDSKGYFIGYPKGMALHSKTEFQETSILYKNLGDGKFKIVDRPILPEITGWNGDASIFDFNRDGFPDLYIADFQDDDRVFENMQGKFFKEIPDLLFPKTSWGTMGLKFFDFNNDLSIDLMTTDMHSDMVGNRQRRKMNFTPNSIPPHLNGKENNILGNTFYKNMGDNTYLEISGDIGAETLWPWGLSVGDINADEFQDVFVSSGMGYPYKYAKNILLINHRGKVLNSAESVLAIEPRSAGDVMDSYFTLQCDGKDEDRIECNENFNNTTACTENGVCYNNGHISGTRSSRSSVIFDMDNDGDLDILTNDFNDYPQVFENNLAQENDIHYLKLRLEGTRSNRNAIGTRVSIYYGDRQQVRYLDSKSGYLSQSQLPLYFGLGKYSSVDKISISWPSGTQQVLDGGIKINSTLIVTEPQSGHPETVETSSALSGFSQSNHKDSFTQFEDVTRLSGINFQHTNGSGSDRSFLIEFIGSGVCAVDYDGDGWQDLLFVNSGEIPNIIHDIKSTSLMADFIVLESTIRERGRFNKKIISSLNQKLTNETYAYFEGSGEPSLYRNMADGTFKLSPVSADLKTSLYGHGCAVGDYDNDGHDDIIITGYGSVHLFKNIGGRGFRNNTLKAGISDMGLSTSAVWFDYNRDGFLDLFIGHYVKWFPEINLICGDGLSLYKKKGIRRYCGPWLYPQQMPVLFKNNGNGTFSDVSKESGVGIRGKNLGVSMVDYNQDGWMDLAIANDMIPNLLLRNTGKGGFIDESLSLGTAVGRFGNAKAGMGIDAADYSNNGETGIVVGNYHSEGLALYRRQANRIFKQWEEAAGLLEPSLTSLTWAVQFVDLDLDGWQDLFIVNGHIDEESAKIYGHETTFRQHPLLFHNRQDGTFTEKGKESGFTEPLLGRGGIYLDYDKDGDLDLVTTELSGPAHLYRNNKSNSNHWLRLTLTGTKSNRNAIGASVRVSANGITQTKWIKSGSGYLGQSEFPLTFGLGPALEADTVKIAWPSGTMQEMKALKADRAYAISEPLQ